MNRGFGRAGILVTIALVAVAIGYFLLYSKAEAPAPVTVPDDTMIVRVYFTNSVLDPEVSCDKVFSVDREVPRSLAPARAALSELIKGPTEDELQAGYWSAVNSDTVINNLVIEDGVARADFSEQLEPGGGSCAVTAVRSQITETLTQFSTVNEVLISVDGRSEDILQP